MPDGYTVNLLRNAATSNLQAFIHSAFDVKQ